MKFAISFLLFAAIALSLASAKPAKGSTKASIKKKTCLQDCNDKELDPVCAGDGIDKDKSFGNECVLSNFNCENGKELRLLSKGECPGGGSIRLS